ncbi:shikimate dehydrogenase [Pedobacter psychrophilus]|uniref:Shikimate dehydrogenase n=1 Tax=Pedobacter psychrophilus TaxID=1826909 RepID=A0A179DDN8_9SPHI|nr:shikimate dehydrogenase [Pedobacter psychrophilus]OAQ38922.1 shikimate dehydrogenase [Pedobacter psychrophilus]
MKKYGLIGFPLTHSFSEKYFTEKFEKENIEETSYSLITMENINDFPKLIKDNPDLRGINVTIPHKINVILFIDELSDEAKGVGAVNCIKVCAGKCVTSLMMGELSTLKGKKLIGYNTDAYGFETSISPFIKPHHKHALILGNGGAAKAIQYVFKKLNIPFKLVSRNANKGILSYDQLSKKTLAEYQIIVNTTPLGTYPAINECPDIPYQYLTDKHLLYDLVYNPEETLFLKKGKEQGATTKNGADMLVLQAEKSWEIWNK